MNRDFAITLMLVTVVILLIIMAYQHAPQPKLPMVHAAAPVADVVPWALTTGCTVTSRNLPRREPERRA